MKQPLPDNGIPVKHGDLSFIFKGVYHPIVWYGDEPYRPRVETLVIKDGRHVFLNMYDTNTAINNERMGSYELPGGSIDNDCDKITQAENEVNEEILVKVKNIYNTGVQYYETFSDGNVEMFKKESPLSYRGFFSEVFCAEYAGKFDAKNVEDKDLDPDMQKGKFYPITLVADKLTEPHINALINCPFVNDQAKMTLRLYLRSKGVTMESVMPVIESKRSDIIKAGGYYIGNKWNAIVEIDNKIYRHRIECIVVKGDKVYLQKKDNGYRIPGGSTEKDIPDIQQIKNECLEEARIVVDKVIPTNCSYIKDGVPKWMDMSEHPVKYTGSSIDIFVANFIRYDKTFEPRPEDYDEMYKYGKFYPMDELNDIHKQALLSLGLYQSTTIESVVPVMEAPGDEDDDEATDYTADADEAPGDGDEEEATDYTAEDDTDSTDEEEEATDYTEDEPEESTDEESEEEPTEDDAGEEDLGDEEEEVTDYTEDDMGDEESSDDTMGDDSSTDGENSEVDKNSIVKNYNLILDFQTLFRYIDEICTGLESTVFKTPIQNSALTQIVNNMRKIRDAVTNYIEFNFGNDYVTNLYNYTIFVKSLKLNLEMLRITKELHTEKSTNK